jgi:hypothetical protein
MITKYNYTQTLNLVVGFTIEKANQNTPWFGFNDAGQPFIIGHITYWKNGVYEDILGDDYKPKSALARFLAEVGGNDILMVNCQFENESYGVKSTKKPRFGYCNPDHPLAKMLVKATLTGDHFTAIRSDK